MPIEQHVDLRVRVLAALADPTRLAVVDALALGDRTPSELAAKLGQASNLLAHHLNVLESAGVIRRVRSEADGRRSYVQLVAEPLAALLPAPRLAAPRLVFVCTQNSARSQLATALWRSRSDLPATSGGMRPAQRVHPGAVATARRHGLDLGAQRPQHVSRVLRPGDLVVSVCDSAHEELSGAQARGVHWSVPDPVRVGTDHAFEQAFDLIESRVARLAVAVTPVAAA